MRNIHIVFTGVPRGRSSRRLLTGLSCDLIHKSYQLGSVFCQGGIVIMFTSVDCFRFIGQVRSLGQWLVIGAGLGRRR
jgi:hypothetical protein